MTMKHKDMKATLAVSAAGLVVAGATFVSLTPLNLPSLTSAVWSLLAGLAVLSGCSLLIASRRVHAWSRKLVMSDTQSQRKLGELAKHLYRQSQLLKNLEDKVQQLEGSSLSMPPEIEDQLAVASDRALSQPRSVFDPTLVTSFTSANASKSVIAGRGAADRLTDPKSPAKLWTLTHADPDPSRMRVAAIAPAAVCERLEDSFEVVTLHPAMLHPELLRGLSAIVLHMAAFNDGQWFGYDSSHATIGATDLQGFLRQAKRRSVPIYAVPDGRIAHFTHEIINLADRVVRREESEKDPTALGITALERVLLDLVGGKGHV